MSEVYFNVKNFSAGRIRWEPTDITGTGSRAYPQLILGLKLQLLPAGQINYTLLRIGGNLFIGNENYAVANFEYPAMAENASSQAYDRVLNLVVPLTLTQIKHIETLRAGNNLLLRITLTGLVILKPSNEFERLPEMGLQISVPRSHWIDNVLKTWNVSDLRLLETNLPADDGGAMAAATKRLSDAEQLYRTGDYPHVLTQLRLAFAAVAERYGFRQADKNMFDKALSEKHPKMRTALRDSFAYFCDLLNFGPHEPTPTTDAPTPVSRNDARFALVTAHAIFEYFSSEHWPGI